MDAKTLLDELAAEIESVKDEDLIDQVPLESGEKVIGQMSDDLKRIFTLMVKHNRKWTEAAFKIVLAGQQPTPEDEEHNYKHKVYQSLLWEGVRRSLAEFHDPIAVRRGGLIVIPVVKEEQTEQEFAQAIN